ncbi:hypothetical protein [Methylocella silvestris]|uniref:Tryptophan synthase subunit beta n=1 Tax=Methylocella silvestris TaxID=199596 RepID=A0A2J7TKS8_METSI|nr:hypothetical protein [Methylocella silvestris]PNG27376.1 hypothetical protein CR492_04525 [Methylocella silvestris]
MGDKDQQRLDRHLDGFQDKLPERVAGWLSWLRRPASRAVRIPAGFLLIAGGVFGFLPILGLWMLPLGILLLAIDVPLLQRPTGRVLVRGRLLWSKWRRRSAQKRP